VNKSRKLILGIRTRETVKATVWRLKRD